MVAKSVSRTRTMVLCAPVCWSLGFVDAAFMYSATEREKLRRCARDFDGTIRGNGAETWRCFLEEYWVYNSNGQNVYVVLILKVAQKDVKMTGGWIKQ
jgi:hypothetical protein